MGERSWEQLEQDLAWKKAKTQIHPDDWSMRVKGVTDLVSTQRGQNASNVMLDRTALTGTDPQTEMSYGGKVWNYGDKKPMFGKRMHKPAIDEQGNYKIDYENIGMASGDASFSGTEGRIPYGGNFSQAEFDITKDIYGDKTEDSFGQLDTGQFRFHKDESGQWLDQDDNPIDAQVVDQAYANQMQKFKNMTQEGMTPQQTWEAGHPLAAGDRSDDGSDPAGTYLQRSTGIGSGRQNDPIQMEDAYAESSPDYLEKRSDLNNPANFPTGRGGTGDGFFSFLKDFKWGKDT